MVTGGDIGSTANILDRIIPRKRPLCRAKTEAESRQGNIDEPKQNKTSKEAKTVQTSTSSILNMFLPFATDFHGKRKKGQGAQNDQRLMLLPKTQCQEVES